MSCGAVQNSTPWQWIVSGQLQSKPRISQLTLSGEGASWAGSQTHQSTYGPPLHEPMVPWLRHMCRCRDFFKGHAIIMNRGARNEKCYLFLFGLQQPEVIAFQELRRVPVVMPLARNLRASSMAGLHAMIDEIWPWQFELDMRAPTYGWDLNHKAVDEVWVLQFLVCRGDRLSSPSEPAPFQDFVRDLPWYRTAEPKTRKRAFDPGFMRDPPEGLAPSSSVEPKDAAADGGDKPDEAPPFADLNDEEKASLRKWLEDKKADLQAGRDTPSTHFVALCRGGNFTARKRGVGSDVAVAQAEEGDAAAIAWATSKIGNRMASFSMKLYGEDLACALARFLGGSHGVHVQLPLGRQASGRENNSSTSCRFAQSEFRSRVTDQGACESPRAPEAGSHFVALEPH